MAGIVLEFSHHGDFDSFGIIRSSTPTSLANLPAPLVTGLSTMFYVDTAVIEGETYYYRPVVWRDGEMAVGDEVEVVALSVVYAFNLFAVGANFVDNKGVLTVTGTAVIDEGALHNTVTSPTNPLWGWYRGTGVLEFEAKGSGNIVNEWDKQLRFNLRISDSIVILNFYTTSPFANNQISFPATGIATEYKKITIERIADGSFKATVDEVEQTIVGNSTFAFNHYSPFSTVRIGSTTSYLKYLRFIEK